MVALPQIGRKLTSKRRERRWIQQTLRQTTQSLAVTEPTSPPFSETATPEEWARALREWSESFRAPAQSSALAYNRESDYEDRF